MIGTSGELAVVLLLAFTPFIITGIYLIVRRKKKPGKKVAPVEKHASNNRTTRQVLVMPKKGSASTNKEPSFGDYGKVPIVRNPEAQTNVEGASLIEQESTPPVTASMAEVKSEINEVAEPVKVEAQVSEGAQEKPKEQTEGLDNLGMPITSAPEVIPKETVVLEIANETFPELDENKLKQYFYYVAKMKFKSMVSSPNILEIQKTLVAKASIKMFHTILCYDRDGQNWETPRPDKSYYEAVWAVPLCNRTVKLSKQHMAAIVSTIQNSMRKLDGVADFPAHNDVIERQARVDDFCHYVDHAVTVKLVSVANYGSVPQRSGDILDLAIADKLEVINGKLCRMVNGETWYTLKAGSGHELSKSSPDRKVASLVISIDFPHVSTPLDAYDEMFSFANKLARVVKYQVLDENSQSIDQEQIQETREHMITIFDFMKDNDVLPGSKLARALFS